MEEAVLQIPHVGHDDRPAFETAQRVAHAGVGSVTFTFGLLLNSLLGVKPTLVPFNGAAPAMNALIAGQVDYISQE